MSNEEISAGGGAAGTSRRAPRQGVGGSPVGSTLSVVLAVVAVVIGFLILRNLTNDDSSASGDGPVAAQPDDSIATTTTFDPIVTTTLPPATTTTEPFVTEGATVVVANGNTIGGSAGRMTETLQGAGFVMGSPTNASETVEESTVYFNPSVTSAEAVAQSVARALGGVTVSAVPTPAPTDSGSLDEAGVLVVLGNSQADKTLESLAEAAGLVPAAPTATAPPVAGDVVAPTDPDAETTDG